MTEAQKWAGKIALIKKRKYFPTFPFFFTQVISPLRQTATLRHTLRFGRILSVSLAAHSKTEIRRAHNRFAFGRHAK
jgi:hypothetical protein